MKDYGEKIWYAVQTDTEDEWGNGSDDYDEAVKMLMSDDDYILIAVIQNGEECIDEIYKDDIIEG